MQGANLQSANLQGANLQNANLRDCNLNVFSLENANLEGVKLEGATCYWVISFVGSSMSLSIHQDYTNSWFKTLEEFRVKGVEAIREKYYLDDRGIAHLR